MSRAFYSNSIYNFKREDNDKILGEISRNNFFVLEELQKNSWIEEIEILKDELKDLEDGYIIFEYTIPRLGSRIDVVCIIEGIIFILEFKVGASSYHNQDVIQVTDYALDLKNFHKASRNALIVPILIATETRKFEYSIKFMKEGILEVIPSNRDNLVSIIKEVIKKFPNRDKIDPKDWLDSIYSPTPTIIEAAQKLYRSHDVEEISRSDAAAINLKETTNTINRIVEKSKAEKRKSICFITGVPGAGKTLAGLNIANDRQKFDENEHAVFLSGNKPLVDVLQEALARDEHKRLGTKKTDARRKAKSLIQIIHLFRDDALGRESPPHEKVVIFDEAQRAWTQDELTKFMANKKGISNFNKSEPEFLIEIMDRHEDWAVLICLIGGGQEINRGEAGLLEWFTSLKNNFKDWDVYLSEEIMGSEYTWGRSIDELLDGINYKNLKELHLSASMRSFRSERLSDLIKAILDVDRFEASRLYSEIIDLYPLYITRDIDKAKKWIREKAKGSERYGMVASSNGLRLKPYGVWVKNKIDASHWFLNDRTDIRSSYFLEEVATEFDIQGLELDWTLMCWDADYRFVDESFSPFSFKGTKWQNIHKEESIQYLKNTYRVLLTRARQGMVIFIPEGNDEDLTRKKEFYDGTYNYFLSLGFREL